MDCETFESLPHELYPLMLLTPLEVVATRLASRALLAAIPRDLFKKVSYEEALSRWESPRFYVSVSNEPIAEFMYKIIIENGTIGDIDCASPMERLASANNKYILDYFGAPFYASAREWWLYVPELRAQAFVLHTRVAGGGKVSPAAALDTLVSTEITGMVRFAAPVKWGDREIYTCLANLMNYCY